MTDVTARAKQLRISPRKIRLVADVVRGQDINDALATLKFMPQKSADFIHTVLKTAQATAEHNYDLDPDDLYVKTIFADDGPTYKRWQPRARGRVNQKLRRTSHLTVIVAEKGA